MECSVLEMLSDRSSAPTLLGCRPSARKSLGRSQKRFQLQNELISNLLPATGLKIVGIGACLPWYSISSSFQNSLKFFKTGYEFLEFWCWNLVPFLPDIGFQLLKSLCSSLMYFLFNDAPNVLYR